MIRSKLGLLGLCTVVFGVMAFAASAAQAEVGAKWLILTSGGVVKTGSELPAKLEIELEKKTVSLLSKVLGIAVQILCTEAKAAGPNGIKLEGEGSLTNGGKVHFNGCIVFLNGTLAPECEAHSPGAPVKLIETNAGKGLLKLVLAGLGATVIEPKETETFVNINMGLECPIGENIPVRGKLVIEDCSAKELKEEKEVCVSKLTEHRVEHLIQEDAAHSDLWVLNKTAEHKATLDGSALAFLAGEHKGLAWSGDPA